MSIVNECMIANLQIGVWAGYRLDKAASQKVTEDANAEADAARVNKHLISKAALKPILTAASSVRTHFYDKTLPWKDNGDRLLTRRMYQQFIETHGGLKDKYLDAVDHFLDVDYPRAVEQAGFRMGELFNPDDYPTARDLKRRFYVNIDIDAVTEAADFRVSLDKEHLAKVQQDMEGAMNERINRAMGDVFGRIGETLKHYHAKMAGEEIFRDSTVRNLEEIVDMLPALNVTNDKRLENIRKDIKKSLIGYSPADLRSDPVVRNVAAGEAKRIMDGMSGIMAAFGGQQ